MASGRGALARLLVSVNRTGLRCNDGVVLLAAPLGAGHRAAFSSSSSSSSSSGLPSTIAAQQPLEQLVSGCSSTAADAAAAASSFAAAQPLEPLAQLLNPFVLGSSIWELGHSMTGLPWWASIPATTLAMRFALLPLTLKAKSAALNWVLLRNSFDTANNLLDQIKQQQRQQQGAAAAAASGDQAPQGASGSPGQQQQQSIEQLKRPGKLKLVRSYYRYFRKQQRTTSMWWWVANAAVQANTFVIMSVALRQMADARWPGMATEGLFWFTDLTHPSVLQWWPISFVAQPYGVAGVLLPLAMTALYIKTVERLPVAVHSWRMKLLLDFGSLPYFGLACLQPQATLLYWAGNSVFFYGLQSALMMPNVARRLGLPNMLLPLPRGATEERERAEQEAADAHKLICGSEDDGFLRFLAANYMSRGRHQQALQCLQRLTVLAPGDSSAFSGLGRTAAELQQWPTAAAAYERSAELHAAVGEVEEQATELVLSGKHWLNAVAEVRQQQQKAAPAAAKDKHGRSSMSSNATSSSNKSSSSSTDASSGAGDEPISWGVNVDKEQDYIDAALRVLQAAVALPAEAASEGRYLLAMAQAAGKQRSAALATSQQYWAAACEASGRDPAARSNAAAKLLPVLANLCKQYHAAGEDESVMATAALAAEVAQAGWDRQSREQLHDTLGAAAQAAAAGGRFELAEQLKGLQGKLLGGPQQQHREQQQQ